MVTTSHHASIEAKFIQIHLHLPHLLLHIVWIFSADLACKAVETAGAQHERHTQFCVKSVVLKNKAPAKVVMIQRSIKISCFQSFQDFLRFLVLFSFNTPDSFQETTIPSKKIQPPAAAAGLSSSAPPRPWPFAASLTSISPPRALRGNDLAEPGDSLGSLKTPRTFGKRGVFDWIHWVWLKLNRRKALFDEF